MTDSASKKPVKSKHLVATDKCESFCFMRTFMHIGWLNFASDF